ncbi:hypothetical protein AL755_08460 [Arthrobacter sp. ERGS1:01]|uniref:hypothetical protein n=1 Tax=Arthrobacter sp. ERGS1:01 TaxID=1704044 RepID=UPI0006B5A104|nr:hypothetical protein [Arthrobacter sp. ERGS1:01]ALE05503.1 hypothetical protein AL755_08460 [Arthrobacter sp. ERGS1:01]
MADSELLKYARARDDQEFVWRVSAAMTVEAQYKLGAQPDMSLEAHKLMDWTLDNPLTPDALMISFASTDQNVAKDITVTEGAVNTSAVTDAAIRAVVGARWDIVAKRRFEIVK